MFLGECITGVLCFFVFCFSFCFDFFLVSHGGVGVGNWDARPSFRSLVSFI